MRRLISLLAVSLPVLAGCARQPAGPAIGVPTQLPRSGAPTIAARSISGGPASTFEPEASPTPGAALVLRVGAGSATNGLASVDARTGHVLARLPIGVPDGRWSTLYAASASSGTTTVRALDIRNGAELRRTALKGSWSLPSVVPSALPVGLAGAANELVLVDTLPPAGATRFALIDTTFTGAPRIITIPGHFSFDAIGPDGHYLFLIEHVSPTGGHYQCAPMTSLPGSSRAAPSSTSATRQSRWRAGRSPAQ